MKNLFPIALLLLAACGSMDNDKGMKDSINAIDSKNLMDTSVSPLPDGYAPPNSDIDTSQRVKDSIQAADTAHMDL